MSCSLLTKFHLRILFCVQLTHKQCSDKIPPDIFSDRKMFLFGFDQYHNKDMNKNDTHCCIIESKKQFLIGKYYYQLNFSKNYLATMTIIRIDYTFMNTNKFKKMTNHRHDCLDIKTDGAGFFTSKTTRVAIMKKKPTPA